MQVRAAGADVVVCTRRVRAFPDIFHPVDRVLRVVETGSIPIILQYDQTAVKRYESCYSTNRVTVGKDPKLVDGLYVGVCDVAIKVLVGRLQIIS